MGDNKNHPRVPVAPAPPAGKIRLFPEPPEPPEMFDFDEDGNVRLLEDADDPPSPFIFWPTGVTSPANPVEVAAPDRECPITVVQEDMVRDRFLCRQTRDNVLKWVTGRSLDRLGLREAFAESTEIVHSRSTHEEG